MPEDTSFIRLGAPGAAPILNYNVPEPTTYSGTQHLELEFPTSYFRSSATNKPTVDGVPLSTVQEATQRLDAQALLTRIRQNDLSGMVAPTAFANAINVGALFQATFDKAPPKDQAAPAPPAGELAVDTASLMAQMQAGQRLVFLPTLWGEPEIRAVKPPASARPRLILVEYYRLSSYLGDYGAGRVIKTFSLLPGEKTKISVKTYKKTEREAKQASSVLDSFTQESAQEFQHSIETENTDKRTQQNNFEFRVEAEGEANWGVARVRAEAEVKGQTAAAREEFGKNTTGATDKHAARASAKRDVSINTSFEERSSEGEETAIEREIENINVSRTLNFVFRQMNQQFVSLLRLVDVRVGFFNGFAEFTQIVPLARLPRLLDEVVVRERHAEVAAAIRAQYDVVFDHAGRPVRNFLENFKLEGSTESFLRVNRGLQTVYESEAGKAFPARGIIIAATENVMRTDGVIVEALLGQGEALDAYSQGLQTQEVTAKEAQNRQRALEAQRLEVALKLAESGDDAAADRFAKLFPPPPKTV